MAIRLAVLTVWISFLALASCGFRGSVAQDPAPTKKQLRAVCAQLVASSDSPPPKLTDEDYELLDRVQLPSNALSPQDLAAVLIALRFLGNVSEEHVPTVVEFALSAEGDALRWPLTLRLVASRRLDLLARIVVASAIDMPKDNRAYGTWKRLETVFGGREDFFGINHELIAHLLAQFETGNEKERDAIADLLGRAGMKNEDLPAMRRAEEEGWKAAEAELRQTWDYLEKEEYAHLTPMVWIEDGQGLRQVERQKLVRSQRSPTRCEIRLSKPGADPSGDWGMLVSGSNDLNGSSLAALHATLREIASAVGDPGEDLGSKLGVITVFSRRRAESPEANSPFLGIADAIVSSACWYAVAFAVVSSHKPPIAAHVERLHSVGKELLTVVRGNAKRMYEAMSGAARAASAETLDAQGNAPEDERVVAVGRDAKQVFLDSIAADVSDPPGTRRNMVFRHHHIAAGGMSAIESAGRTRVIFADDRVTIFVFAESHMEMLAIPREALRDAQFVLRETGAPEGGTVGGCELVVTAKKPFATRRIELPGPGPGVLRRFTQTQEASIDCDSNAHGEELRGDLERFAAGRER